ncbi:hypothetical protein N7463_010144 [Penicillium fimorum]|uniref:Uncharacterized protein n=1 Tax=Penicillium fimorum TaxID=1882269 RepID=A0A9W9XJB7_9EURO|nr:hypothetical protein N7463_010144 [Penicillium fimorum]
MTTGFKKLFHFVPVRKAAPRVTANGQPTTPEFIELQDIRTPGNVEGPPVYERFPEEPLPAYKQEGCFGLEE